MKRILIIVSMMGLVAGTAFAAGPPASDSITVTANNVGVFTFNIVAASYSFGSVDANGNVSGSDAPAPAVTTNASGAIFTTTSASSWTCNSAPSRTVRIYNASTVSAVTLATPNRLRMQIPAAGGGTSCAFKTFGTTGDGALCAAGVLVHSMTVGNNGSAVTGTLDFELTIDNTDATGANSWTVLLTAAGV